MIFMETAHFTRIIADYLSDDEQGEFQARLIENPMMAILSRVQAESERFDGAQRARAKAAGYG
jgi:hypothetical protein